MPEVNCGSCLKPCREDDSAVQCHSCQTWFHSVCLKVSVSKLSQLAAEKKEWYCAFCFNTLVLEKVAQQERQIAEFHKVIQDVREENSALKTEVSQLRMDVDQIRRENVQKNKENRGPNLIFAAPLKGIPSRVPDGGGFRSLPTASPVLPRGPSIRKDGGIKLLDITEQPIGYAQAKKRKRMQELEDAKRAAELAQAAPPATPASVAPQTPATPDYAAGLTPLNPPTPLQPPATPGVYTPQPASTTPTVVTTPIKEPPTNVNMTTPVQIKTEVIMTSPQTPNPAVSTIVQPQSHLVTQQQQLQPPPQLTPLTPAPPVQTQQVQTPAPQQTTPTVQNVIFRSPHITQLTIAPPSISQQTNLALTREQMIEAQEMFQTANKVTRPEKALILGFMAGSRENPCPQLGNIVTIKLSENLENVLQQDKTYLTMLVETHFQMNYNTGEWKRIKKFRNIDANQLAQQRAAAAAAAAAQAAAQANAQH